MCQLTASIERINQFYSFHEVVVVRKCVMLTCHFHLFEAYLSHHGCNFVSYLESWQQPQQGLYEK